MEKNELTFEEKATLLGHVDVIFHTDYDRRFYNDLCTITTPFLHKMNDRSRRAITKYVTALWKDYKEVTPEFDDDTKFLAALTEVLLKGYELGRKRKRPLTRG